MICVSGKLAMDDAPDIVPGFERLVGKHGMLQALFDMADLHAWEISAAWEGIRFASAQPSRKIFGVWFEPSLAPTIGWSSASTNA